MPSIPGFPNLLLAERGQQNFIPIGCDVCIEEVSEAWLTLTCGTNVNQFPNESLTIVWENENGETLEGIDGLLIVQRPGTYTCRAIFSEIEDSVSTTVSCKHFHNLINFTGVLSGCL